MSKLCLDKVELFDYPFKHIQERC